MMNIKLVVAVALIVVLAAGGFLVQQFVFVEAEIEAPVAAAVDSEVDTTALPIDFSLTGLDGIVRNLSDWSGRARLVNFWATWCAPCRREIPLLKTLQDGQGDDGLQVIGIAVDFREDVIAYAEEAEFNYPILVGQEDAMAAAEISGVQFIGLPFTLVVSREGVLLTAHIGEIVEAQLEHITTVLDRVDRGELDTAGARAALHSL